LLWIASPICIVLEDQFWVVANIRKASLVVDTLDCVGIISEIVESNHSLGNEICGEIQLLKDAHSKIHKLTVDRGRIWLADCLIV
jgi:hypothetical protein